MSNKPEISVAPMMDWTTRHCRYFHRLIAPNVRLYTEMVTTGALLHGDAERFLRFDEAEHPVALQLGGSDAQDLAACAEMGAREGYDEINLNCGCPSDRVQKGKIGAILMTEPDLVAACFEAMQARVDVPVTIKCRIGIDEQDSFEFLDEFVGKSADKGCKTFIIHARKAWLSGLSPKQNREVPPLDYGRVEKVKEKYPELRIILNGGITTLDAITNACHLEQAEKSQAAAGDSSACGVRNDSIALDGAMIGREAYSNPYFLATLEERIYGTQNIKPREEIAKSMIKYAQEQKERYDTPVKSITRHILGLYHGQKGAKQWKRTLSTLPYETGANESVIERALDAVKEATKEATS